MKKLYIITGGLAGIVSSLGIFGCSVEAPPTQQKTAKIIYDADDRLEYGALNNNPQKKWADATAALFAADDVQCVGQQCALSLFPFEVAEDESADEQPLCEDAAHKGQLKGASCTAFLVGPDLMATAGHCIDSCEDFKVVFGFTADADGSGEVLSVGQENVFECEEIIADTTTSRGDWAVFRIDREAEGRVYFPIRREGKLVGDEDLVMIGHSNGLPLKYSPDGSVRYNGAARWLFTDIDAFSGNSGSPIIDAATGVVEAIHARRPASNYVTSTDENGATCVRERVCDQQEGCREDTTGPNVDWLKHTRIKYAAQAIEEEVPECSIDSDCDWPTMPDCVSTSCNAAFQCETDKSACECSSSSECDDGRSCTTDLCFVSTLACIHIESECEEECSEETATDLGADGQTSTVAADGCIRVSDAYPGWWGNNRSMSLQTTSGGDFPVPFSWSQECGGAGTGSFSGSWQSQTLNSINSNCATVIDLNGAPGGSLSLRYFAQ